MKRILKYIALLMIGGAIYYLIEIVARGFSHWTMFFVGGICFILVGLINEITPKMSLVKQMALSALIITSIEFFSGCILNLWLGLNIWDYSDQPLNFMGQISAKHTLYWFLLSLVGIVLDDYIRYFFYREEKPKYNFFERNIKDETKTE